MRGCQITSQPLLGNNPADPILNPFIWVTSETRWVYIRYIKDSSFAICRMRNLCIFGVTLCHSKAAFASAVKRISSRCLRTHYSAAKVRITLRASHRGRAAKASRAPPSLPVPSYWGSKGVSCWIHPRSRCCVDTNILRNAELEDTPGGSVSGNWNAGSLPMPMVKTPFFFSGAASCTLAGEYQDCERQ